MLRRSVAKAMVPDAQPVLPDYGGACLDRVIPALLAPADDAPAWVPAPAVGAAQVVLLVLDGLGWDQLRTRAALAPNLAAMEGGPITSVAPSTTAAALTSLTTSMPPAAHGVVGYRVRLPSDEVLNVLRWRTAGGDARMSVPPAGFQALEPFGGAKPPVVTKAEFVDTGFTTAHLAGSPIHGWRLPSTLVTHVARLLRAGERFVYAYYPGIDTVAHEFGFGPYYDAELTAADRLVGDLLDALPPGAALAVVADHGQVDVGEAVLAPAPEVAELTGLLSGEGRFRWLHALPGLAPELERAAHDRYDACAWVRTRVEAVAEGWFGGPLAADYESRLGDVVLAARDAVAFLDQADTGEYRLRCRHGSLTRAEVLVPLVAARA